VGDEQHGGLLLAPDRQQLVLLQLAGLRIQGAEGLVHQEHGGIRGHGDTISVSEPSTLNDVPGTHRKNTSPSICRQEALCRATNRDVLLGANGGFVRRSDRDGDREWNAE